MEKGRETGIISESHQKNGRLCFRRLASFDLDETKTERAAELKEYIYMNVQSRRKSILELYTHTISPSEDQTQSLDNQLPTSGKRNTKKGLVLEHLDKMGKGPGSNGGKGGASTERAMLISSKLQLNSSPRTSPRSKLRQPVCQTIKDGKVATPRPLQSISVRKQLVKMKAPLPVLPIIKSPSLQLQQISSTNGWNEINPWQHLVIADHFYFSKS